MTAPRNSNALVLDMIASCEDILGYTHSIAWNDFIGNKMLQDAVLYQITVLGEAANNISRDYAETHSEIPWSAIAGMRHRVVHDYGHVNLKVVWDTVKVDIPKTLAQLNNL